MKGYTYKDYLIYQRIKAESLKVMEDSRIYQIEEKNRVQKHDKIFKEILDNKKEAVKFLNSHFKLKSKLKEEDIEKYTRKFVLPNLENRESDIIYKLKEKHIFFLIEHQSKLDYSMPIRILEYSMEIIKSATSREKMKQKGELIANVYPIVLYTGERKWTVPKSINHNQIHLQGIKPMISNRYELVDINDYKQEELMQEDNFLSKAMLLEKVKDPKKILEALRRITDKKLDTDDRYFLRMIITYLLARKMEKKIVKEILDKLMEKGEESMFIDVLSDYFDEREAKARKLGEKRGEKRGEKQGVRKVIIEMLKNKVDEEVIKKSTKVKSKELEQIKKELLTKSVNL